MRTPGEIIDALDNTMTALQAGFSACRMIEEELAGVEGKAKLVTAMTAAAVVVVETAKTVGAHSGKPPREVLAKIIESALMQLPEEPPKELKTRASKRKGASPWAL